MLDNQKVNGYLKCHSCGYMKMVNPIITLEEYITSGDAHPEMLAANDYNKEVQDNANKLLDKVNAFLHDIGIDGVKVNSGWRSPEINAKIPGAAKSSNHLKALAIDLSDKDGNLRKIVLENLEKAQQYGLYFEDMRWTATWLHIQCVPPVSKHRIYVPSTAPATKPDAWSGTYDKKFDS